MSVLGGILGVGEVSYIQEPKEGDEGRGLLQVRLKALKEWMHGVGLRGQPEVEGTGKEGGLGR